MHGVRHVIALTYPSDHFDSLPVGIGRNDIRDRLILQERGVPCNFSGLQFDSGRHTGFKC